MRSSVVAGHAAVLRDMRIAADVAESDVAPMTMLRLKTHLRCVGQVDPTIQSARRWWIDAGRRKRERSEEFLSGSPDKPPNRSAD